MAWAVRAARGRTVYRGFIQKMHHTGMAYRIFNPPTPQQWLLARALACALAAWSLVSASALTSNGAPTASKSLPDLGDGTEMSPAAERRLGDSIARSLYRDPDYLDDPVLAGYVQSIWQPLLDAARARGDLRSDMEELYAWDILLARDRSVNAFALPGGYFGLHLGLVAIVTTRDELASVLGHELSHVTQRHIARNINKQSAQQPWMIGAMILGMLAAAKSNSPDAANAMIIGGQAAAIQSQLNFSRDMEREADRVGFGVSTAAGFAPEGFVGMFEKLQMANRLNDSGNFPYLRSHPLTTERIADMQNRISLTTPSAPAPPAQWEPLMVAARARLLSNPGVDALRAWEADVQPDALQTRSPAQQAATLYGATLAAVKLREFDRVQPLLSRLQAQVRGRPVALRLAQLLGAEASMARGDAPDGAAPGARAACRQWRLARPGAAHPDGAGANPPSLAPGPGAGQPKHARVGAKPPEGRQRLAHLGRGLRGPGPRGRRHPRPSACRRDRARLECGACAPARCPRFGAHQPVGRSRAGFHRGRHRGHARPRNRAAAARTSATALRACGFRR